MSFKPDGRYYNSPRAAESVAACYSFFQLRMEWKQIDLKLTTTSMKLVEEKSLLRRKNHIRARLKELAGFESVMLDMQALKVGHSVRVRALRLLICYHRRRGCTHGRVPHTRHQRQGDRLEGTAISEGIFRDHRMFHR